MIKLDLHNLYNVKLNDLKKLYAKKMHEIQKNFINHNHYMMGWINYFESDAFKNDYELYKIITNKWRKLKINNIVVIGIGGSYNGIRASLEFLNKNNDLNFIYLSELSAITLNSLKNTLKNKNWAIVIISKSGTTIETSINFRIVRELLFKKYKKNYFQRIVAITDADDGILNKLSNKHQYWMLTIPKNIGGRYSTLTSTSLFLMYYAKININQVISSYKKFIVNFLNKSYCDNIVLQYVSLRDYLKNKQKLFIEVFQLYDEHFAFIGAMYKQLFAESEGKKANTIFPVVSILSNDLHAIGQLYQEGYRNFFQTTLYINQELDFFMTESSFKNDDQLDYLNNKTINEIKKSLSKAVIKAHAKEAHNQNILIEVSGNNNEIFGTIYAFLALAASVSSYLNNVDPFNQPGVENYKQNLAKILK